LVITVSITCGVRQLRLAHAVADHLAAAELDLLAVDRVVAFDLDHQAGVGQADAVARGGAEHVGIGLARDRRHAGVPPRRQRAVHAALEADRHARAGQLDQFHRAALARLEAHRGAGRDVQAHAERCSRSNCRASLTS
jgi:hypothetical protein